MKPSSQPLHSFKMLTQAFTQKSHRCKPIFYVAICTLFLLSFYSCSVGYDAANNYVEKFNTPKTAPQERIYVALPQYVIHTNSKLAKFEGFQNLSGNEKDKLIESNTRFLNKVNDSVLIAQFNEHFLYNLSRLGIPVIVTNAESLPSPVAGMIYTINVAQMEAEENIEIETLKSYAGKKEYYEHNVELDVFSLNIWISYNEKDTALKKVYYKTFEVGDRLSGDIFSAGNNEGEAVYEINKMNLNDIYYMPYVAGKMTATLFIEKWINDYVMSQNNNGYYYFYDPKTNRVTDYISKAYLNKKYLFEEVKDN